VWAVASHLFSLGALDHSFHKRDRFVIKEADELSTFRSAGGHVTQRTEVFDKPL
jgi:hypothetical protein